MYSKPWRGFAKQGKEKTLSIQIITSIGRFEIVQSKLKASTGKKEPLSFSEFVEHLDDFSLIFHVCFSMCSKCWRGLDKQGKQKTMNLQIITSTTAIYYSSSEAQNKDRQEGTTNHQYICLVFG